MGCVAVATVGRGGSRGVSGLERAEHRMGRSADVCEGEARPCDVPFDATPAAECPSTKGRPSGATRRATTSLPAYATGPAGGYTPSDLAAAYGANLAVTAAGSQLVAIVDAFNDPNMLPELNTFDSQYGLPTETSTSFEVVNQSGATSPLPANNSNWAGEIALDVQTVRGVVPRVQDRASRSVIELL